MLSEKLAAFAHASWQEAKKDLGDLGNFLQKELNHLTGEEKLLVELALGTLPASDVASVPVSVLQNYAKHALFLRENSPFCKDLPEDIFLHCVYYPRINSEDLVDCRHFFWEKLAPIVEGKNGVEAALAVNRWCAAQMTYETTDTRSINPMTAYSCGLGRCGEESTFGVTALRAVGIPARQIYVPWWSHCDDNHAWVEAYVDGAWHFLGACEPEPILDKGWFVNASSRAMLVCSRNFFDFVGEGLKDEALVQKQGMSRMYNQTKRYANTEKTVVEVLDEKGQPIQNAWVRFYVLNMASTARIAALQTDEKGLVELETGKGSCLIEAEHQGRFAWKPISVETPAKYTLVPSVETPAEDSWTWDFVAPSFGQKHYHPLTNAQVIQKSEELKAAKKERLARINGYWTEKYQTDDPEMDEIYHMAGGNVDALWNFYIQYGEKAKVLLRSLASKDWRDAKPEVLAAHLSAVEILPQDSKEFVKYIQCPRIGFELLTPWRSAVKQALSQQQMEEFTADPVALWAWICENFQEKNCRWHPVLWLQPGAALALHAADLKGRRLLFVAILRTLGVAARLDPVDSRAQYFKDGVFHTVEAAEPWEPKAALQIHLESGMEYEQSWTLSRWNSGWQTLSLSGEELSDLHLPLGLYRLCTTNRLPNGNQLARFQTFRLSEDMEITAQRREAQPEQLLSRYPVQLPTEISGLELQLYLEVGAEPTEHSLNELMENADRVRRNMEKGLKIHVFLPRPQDREDPTLQKALKVLPEILVEETSFDNGVLETLARSLYLEPGMWPLITVTDGSLSYYGHGGYAVGSIPMALQLAELLEK